MDNLDHGLDPLHRAIQTNAEKQVAAHAELHVAWVAFRDSLLEVTRLDRLVRWLVRHAPGR